MGFSINTNAIRTISKNFSKMTPMDLKYGIGRTKGNIHTPRPQPKPMTAEERAEMEARWEVERIKREQEEAARKIEEAKKAEEARIKALKDGTWLENECFKYGRGGQIARKFNAENNAIEAPVIENEKTLPKRIRNMINILRERGYAVEYRNGILKGEYRAKDEPYYMHEHQVDDFRGIVLIDTKNNKILGCNDVIKEKYFDRFSNAPKVSLGRKGQIKVTKRCGGGFGGNPYIETTYYDKDTGKFIKSIEQAIYDDNPYRNLFGMESTPKLNKEAVTYHKIVTTKEPDGTFKSVLYDPHTLSVAEYTGEKGNKTLKITQWETPTSEECEVLTLTQEDLDRFDRYYCSDYFHRVWDKGSGYDLPTHPTLDQIVPRIENIKRAKERIDQLFEAGRLKFEE